MHATALLQQSENPRFSKPSNMLRALSRSSRLGANRINSASFSSELAFNKYPFLERLGLKEENLGCWNGKEWVHHCTVFRDEIM